MIELVNVYKRFGTLQVLNGVSLTFKTGENTVILGKSGSGKSVLLKHVVRLLDPDDGSVLVDGKNIGDFKLHQLMEYRKTLGFLFQGAALYDSLSVFENVAFPIRRHTKTPDKEVEYQVMEALGWVSLTNAAQKMPSELSGGMRKRVGLARSLILKPKVMLYDEPTTGLDPITSNEISDLILNLQKQFGTTGLIVTHDMPCAFKVADRAILLSEGNILFDGGITELENSNEPLVKTFYETSVAKRPELSL